MPQRKISHKRQIGGTATEVSYDAAEKGKVYTFLPYGDIAKRGFRYTAILDTKITQLNSGKKKLFKYLDKFDDAKPYITDESKEGQNALDQLDNDATEETKKAVVAEAVKNFYEKEDLKEKEEEAAKEAAKVELTRKEADIFAALTFEENDLVKVEGNLELYKNYYFKLNDGKIYYGRLDTTSWGNYTFNPYYDASRVKVEVPTYSISREKIFIPKNRIAFGGKNRTKHRKNKNRTRKTRTRKTRTRKTRRGTKKRRNKYSRK